MNKSTVIIISILVLIGLFVRLAPTHLNVSENMPPVITSWDVFWHTTFTKWIVDSHNSDIMPSYKTGGIPALSPEPRILPINSAALTWFTGIPAYQTAFIFTALMSLIVVLLIFVVVRRYFGETAGIITLFLGIVPVSAQTWFFQMMVGFWRDFGAMAMALAGIIILLQGLEAGLSWKHSAVIGILFSGALMAHAQEFFFYAPFLGGVVVLWMLFKKTTWHSLIKTGVALLIAIVLSINFLSMMNTSYQVGGSLAQGLSTLGTFQQMQSYFPSPSLPAIFTILIIAGLGISALNFKKLSITKLSILALWFFFLFVSFSRFIGLNSNYTTRQIYMGYALLLLPAVIAIMFIISLINAKVSKKVTGIAIIILGFVYVLSFAPTSYSQFSNLKSSFGDKAHWDAIIWIKDNTPKDAKVFALSGYEHEFYTFSERTVFKGDLGLQHTQTNIQQLCNQQIPEKFRGEWGYWLYNNPKGYAVSRIGYSDFNHEMISDFNVSIENDTKSQEPLSKFNYVLFQHSGEQWSPCMQWFKQQMINNNHHVVYENEEMAIVKL